MSERYSRLFSLPENLYATGSPVILAAGALLKDNQTGKVLVQLKIQNIQAVPVKAVTVSIQPLDTVGNSLGDKVEYQYLDLNCRRNDNFGAKIPIKLPNPSTRSFTVSVIEVIFADNTIWNTAGEPWESLSAPVSLENALSNWELVTQYRMKFGADCKYTPTFQKDLWYCACGELNSKDSVDCYRCGKSADELMNVDMDALQKACSERIAAEKRKAEEEKAAADARARKSKKIALIIVAAVVAVSLLAVLLVNIVKRSKEEAARQDAYNTAVALLEDEYYFDAIDAFSALGDYKDSAEKLALAQEGAAVEQSFIDLMSESITKAAPLIDSIAHPSEKTKVLIEICEKYLPYCGTYSWLSEEGYAIDIFSFQSDFYAEGGSVYWIYDDSKYEYLETFTVIYADPSMNSETYQLLRNPLPIDGMTAYEHNSKDLMDLTIRFENEQIYADFGYFDGQLIGGELKISNSHNELFSMESVKK